MPKGDLHDAEDYLEAIYLLQFEGREKPVSTLSIAKMLRTSPATVTGAFRALAREGLVKYSRYYGVTLTEEGERRARGILTKHRVLEAFAKVVLEVEDEEAIKGLCGAEHHLSGEVVRRICELVSSREPGFARGKLPCKGVCEQGKPCAVV